MKLVYPEWEEPIPIEENQALTISMENRSDYFRTVDILKQQLETGEGPFHLYTDEDKELNLKKSMVLFLSPWNLDFHDRQLEKKLLARLHEMAMDEDHYPKTQKILGSLLQYLEELQEETPLNFTYDWEPVFSDICKALHLGLDDQSLTLPEKMLEYMRAWTELCGETCFVFNQFRAYLSEEERKAFYETAWGEKLPFLMLEGACHDKIKEERFFTIDEDYCQFFE